MQTHDWIGYSGILLIAIFYARILYHLIVKKCTVNICLTCYFIWLFASVMLAIYAFSIPSFVFILATLVQAFCSAAVIIYTYKYRNQHCDHHRQ